MVRAVDGTGNHWCIQIGHIDYVDSLLLTVGHEKLAAFWIIKTGYQYITIRLDFLCVRPGWCFYALP